MTPIPSSRPAQRVLCVAILFLATIGPHAATIAVAANPERGSGQLPSTEITPQQCWTDFLAGLDRPELGQFHDLRFAMIRFEDRYRVRLRNGVLTDTGDEAALTDPTLAASLARLESWGVRWLRGAPDVGEEEIDAMLEGAVHPGGLPVPDLNNIYMVQVPDELEAPTVIRELHGKPGIEYALFVNQPQPSPQASGPAPCIPDFSDLTAPADTNLIMGAQWYLAGVSTNRPVGIDAFYAWEGIYGDGTGVRIIDIEYNFNANHVDLPSVEMLARPGLGLPRDLSGDHGTAVLGILGGLDNGFGVKGIAHGADFKFVSEWRKAFNFFGSEIVGVDNRFAAIVQAMAVAGAGDILLLEIQATGPTLTLVPAEWDRAVYDATVAAVASGRILVAVAGNGATDLDGLPFRTNVPGWPEGQGPFLSNNRSGAIIVGGAVPAGYRNAAGNAIPGLVATSTSSFGSRVDLQGWGQWVMTTGYGGVAAPGAEVCYRPMNQDLQFRYTSSFNGTSAATPIVAGAAAVVQSTFKNAFGRAATPAEMRELLVSTGTAQGPGNLIGPLPNLRAAIESLADPAVLNPAPPVIFPAFGTNIDGFIMRLDYGQTDQDFDNTILTYTLDGSDPTLESSRFIPEFDSGLFLRETVTVKTRAFRRDAALQRWFDGPILGGQYQFSNQIPPVRFIADATGTTVTNGDSFGWPFTLRLETDVSDVLIRYTLGPWDEAAAVEYTGPITFDAGSHFLVARAYRAGLVTSNPAGILFTVVQYGSSSAGGQTQANPPFLLPQSGVYQVGTSVSITPPHLFATVHFTLDGTEPDVTSPLYSTALNLTSSTVVKARAFAPGTIPSETVTEIYTIIGGMDPPLIAPAGGGFLGTRSILLSHPEPEAEIRYTTHGGDPGVTSTLYDGPITLPLGSYTLKARAFLHNNLSSTTATASFTFYDPDSAVQPPVILPRENSQTLIFTLRFEIPTEGATVRYTINDTDPGSFEVTTADFLYDPNAPPQLGALPGGENYLIRARTFKDGVGSLQVQKNYNVFWPFDDQMNRLEVADVSIEPAPGVYHDTVPLLFRTGTPSVQFRYTTDGSVPPESSATTTANNLSGVFQPSQSGTVHLNQSAIVSVVGTRLGHFHSEVAKAEYVLQCAVPVFEPSAQTNGIRQVVFSTETPNATIRYTTDGSGPTLESSAYSEPLLLGEGSHLLQARAFRQNFEPSDAAILLLGVEAPPLPVEIVQSPEDLTVTVGETAIFRVEATGYPSPTFAWKRNGLLLGQDDPVLVLLNVQTNDAAAYTVAVSNGSGSVETEPVRLTVLPALSPIEAWREEFFDSSDNAGDGADDADPDDDGSPNRDEFEAGTDPTEAGSVFKILSVRRDISGTVSLGLPTVERRSYQVFASYDLSGWISILDDVAGTGGDVVLTLEPPAFEDGVQVYFRVEVTLTVP